MRERATILIVDDEAELCEVLRGVLNAQGYTALGAENAGEGAATSTPTIAWDLRILKLRRKICSRTGSSRAILGS